LSNIDFQFEISEFKSLISLSRSPL